MPNDMNGKAVYRPHTFATAPRFASDATQAIADATADATEARLDARLEAETLAHELRESLANREVKAARAGLDRICAIHPAPPPKPKATADDRPAQRHEGAAYAARTRSHAARAAIARRVSW